MLLEKAGDVGRSGRREVRRRDWDEQLNDYVLFVKERNRDPSQYGEDPRERALSFWLRNQKASLRNGLLLLETATKLDEPLPGWSSPHSLRPSWEEMLARTVQFEAEWGRRPSALSLNRDERILATWLHRQGAARTAIRDRRHADRVLKLNHALPHWRGRPPLDQKRWNIRLEQLLEHVQKYGRLPVMGPASPHEEYALGKWMSVQWYALKTARWLRNVWQSWTKSSRAGGGRKVTPRNVLVPSIESTSGIRLTFRPPRTLQRLCTATARSG